MSAVSWSGAAALVRFSAAGTVPAPATPGSNDAMKAPRSKLPTRRPILTSPLTALFKLSSTAGTPTCPACRTPKLFLRRP
ncbi:hypothetical protein PI125_g18216 [Phytophthora idaei]|nr:hypothetical protein PI125_g18216 [Phytophthora idaei]